jgi:outer membrane protein assembly factor BamB
MITKHSFLISIKALTGLGLLVMALSSCAPHWPQFRGPEQNMIATGKKLPVSWSDSTHIRWTAVLDGESWSSPIVYVNKVFVTSCVPVSVTPPPENQGPPPAEGEEDMSWQQDVYRWEVSCYDLENGELLWKQVAREGHPRIKKNPATNYAGESPVTDGKYVYVYFGMTGVFCYTLKGEPVWEKDLGAYPTQRGWGTGSSPVLYKDRLFVQVDNEELSFLVALDAENGEEVWKVDRDEKTNYSTPFIWKNNRRTELVTGGKKARSYDPETGELYWELSVEGFYNIPSPVADRDYLYLGNAGFRDTPGTLFCIRAGAQGDITPGKEESTSSGVVWSDADAPTANPSPLLYKGFLYLISSRGGQVYCYNAFNGNPVYEEKVEGVAGCWASPWAQGDRIFFTDEKGVTYSFAAGRTFELLGKNSLDDTFWASVAVAGNEYIMKGVERMFCISN